MDWDSLAIVVSFASLFSVPFWPRVLASLLPRQMTLPVPAFAILTSAGMAVFFIGPWVLMAAWHGLLQHDLSEPDILLVAAAFFGPAVAVQAAYAVSFAMRDRPAANRPL